MRYLHVAFFLTGVVTTLLGPLVPLVRGDWGLDDGRAGAMLGTQFLSSVLGGGISTALAARVGPRPFLAASFALMATGLAGLSLSAWPFVVPAAALFGFAIGLVVPVINLTVARAHPHRAAAALSVLNLMWSAGAVAWPVTVAVLAAHVRPALLPAGVAVAAAAIAAGFALGWGPAAHPTPPPPAPARRDGSDGWALAGVFAAAFFLYGGAETSLGGWVATYTQRVDARQTLAAAWVTAAYWGALTTGRLLMPAVLAHVRDGVVLFGGLAMSALAVAAMMTTSSATVIVAAAVVAGLGFAGVFPIAVALSARDLGARATLLAGPLITMGGLGGAVGPWLVGVVSQATDSLRTGLGVVLASTVLLIGAHAARSWLGRRGVWDA